MCSQVFQSCHTFWHSIFQRLHRLNTLWFLRSYQRVFQQESAWHWIDINQLISDQNIKTKKMWFVLFKILDTICMISWTRTYINNIYIYTIHYILQNLYSKNQYSLFFLLPNLYEFTFQIITMVAHLHYSKESQEKKCWSEF